MSIFDIEKKEKNPITVHDLLMHGFKYGKDNVIRKSFHFGREIKWVARFWLRGDVYKGRKLRSNRLVVRYVNVEQYRKEIHEAMKLRNKGIRFSTPQPTFKKVVMRNIDRSDFEAAMLSLRNNYDSLYNIKNI